MGGFLKSCEILGQLPREYQLALKWTASQTAHLVYGIFVAGDESRGNLNRAKEICKMMPWQTIASAMRSPAFAMLRQIQDRILQRRFVQGTLELLLQDDSETIQAEIKTLRLSIHSNTIERKIRKFVEAPEQFKEMVRKSARESGIPLAVAIVRGSDEPQLNRPTLERVLASTKVYQAFIATRPNAVQKLSNKTSEYQFIRNLQRLLRLYSLWRDGRQIRSCISNPTVADAVTRLCQPLAEMLCHLQRVPGSEDCLLGFSSWIKELLDLCDGLRSKIQDPARSMGAITEHLECGFRDAYACLHQVALEAPEILPFDRIQAFLHKLAEDGAAFTFDETEQSSETPPSAAGSTSDDVDLATIAEDIQGHARRHLLRAQEIFARWIVGDCEDESSILIIGDMAGKTRKEPFFPRELPQSLRYPQLDSLLPTLRAALSKAFGSSGPM